MLDQLNSFLAEDQRKRLEKISTQTREEEFLGVRSILYQLYQNYERSLGPSPTSRAAVELTQDELGRPYLRLAKDHSRDDERSLNLRIDVKELHNDTVPSVSLSHSKQWLAAVISDQSRIGIDLETSNRTVSEALKRRFFTEQEIQEGVFTDHPIWLWVIKEAVVKCIGTGIQSDLTKVVVRMAAPDTLTPENWHIEWYPSTPRWEEMMYRFYASYATQGLFEGKLYVNPYYVCAFAVPILNEGGNDG
jgi:phosphopantetheinyl transferase